jgi:hypothetical protein
MSMLESPHACHTNKVVANNVSGLSILPEPIETTHVNKDLVNCTEQCRPDNIKSPVDGIINLSTSTYVQPNPIIFQDNPDYGCEPEGDQLPYLFPNSLHMQHIRDIYGDYQCSDIDMMPSTQLQSVDTKIGNVHIKITDCHRQMDHLLYKLFHMTEKYNIVGENHIITSVKKPIMESIKFTKTQIEKLNITIETHNNELNRLTEQRKKIVLCCPPIEISGEDINNEYRQRYIRNIL